MKASLMAAGLCAAALLWGCAKPARVEAERPTRVAVLRLGPSENEASGVMLGTHVTAGDLNDAADALAADQPDIVLIHISADSAIESPVHLGEFIDVLERKPFGRARVIAYIREGLGAPGALAWCFPELFVHPAGKIGYFSFTPPYLVNWTIEGRPLFRLLCQETIDAATLLSKRPILVGRAMCGQQKLYWREVTAPESPWSETAADGSLIVCGQGQLLIFYAEDLVARSLARGIATDEDDAISHVAPPGAIRVGASASVLLSNRIARAIEADRTLREQYARYASDVVRLYHAGPTVSEVSSITALLAAMRVIVADHPRIGAHHGLGPDWLDDQDRLLARLFGTGSEAELE
jgi:hypothetical protein